MSSNPRRARLPVPPRQQDNASVVPPSYEAFVSDEAAPSYAAFASEEKQASLDAPSYNEFVLHNKITSSRAPSYKNFAPRNAAAGGDGNSNSVPTASSVTVLPEPPAYDVVAGGRGTGKSGKRQDQIDKLEGMRETAQQVEYAVNAAEYAENYRQMADLACAGAEAVKGATDAVQQTSAATGVTVQAAANTTQDVGNTAEGAELTSTLAQAGRDMATEQIVDGHKYHACIDNTCLEEPVRCVAENCAVPMYEFLGTTCCKCWCSGGADTAVENTGQVAENTADAADTAGEGFSAAERCADTMCGVFDMADCCIFDEALAYALPFCGLVFSCLRLYQGTTLSCRGSMGMWSAIGSAKGRFKWMVAEGHARLWQGCCGLLGAAPGLIIVTLPSILACSLVARKARKRRLALETGDEDGGDGKTEVVTSQPLPGGPQPKKKVLPVDFPSDEERSNFYNKAYQSVSGRLPPGQDPSPELVESGVAGLVPVYIYPDAPRGAWSTGLFDCTDHVPSCVRSFLCPCITAGQVGEGARLFTGVFYVTVVVFSIDYLFALGGYLWVVFGTYIVYMARSRIAKVYDIPVHPFENFCIALFCSFCAMTQVARHLFAWGQAGDKNKGWLEMSARPVSKWSAVPQRPPTVHSVGGFSQTSSGHHAQGQNGTISLQNAYQAQVVHAPAAVAPMARA